MAEAADHSHRDIDELKFARSVARGVGVALPVSLILITLALWLILDVDLTKAFAIGVWPALLTGVFGGGFVGVVRGSK